MDSHLRVVLFAQRHCPVRDVGTVPRHHGDAVVDGADGEAERAAGAIFVHDLGDVGDGVHRDRLVPSIVARPKRNFFLFEKWNQIQVNEFLNVL